MCWQQERGRLKAGWHVRAVADACVGGYVVLAAHGCVKLLARQRAAAALVHLASMQALYASRMDGCACVLCALFLSLRRFFHDGGGCWCFHTLLGYCFRAFTCVHERRSMMAAEGWPAGGILPGVLESVCV